MNGDVTIIKLTGVWGHLVLFNIYNNCNHDLTIRELTKFCRIHHKQLFGRDEDRSTCHIAWLGDFNRHHPVWDNPNDTRLFKREAFEAAEVLIKTLADLGLELALAAGTPTHVHNVTKKWTRLDQVFITEHTLDKVVLCETRSNERGLNTDHIPIVTKLDVTLDKTSMEETNNFRDVDWEEFRKELEEKMKAFNLPRKILTQAELDRECARLTKAIQDTITMIVPVNGVCPKSKRWWTREIKEFRKKFRKIGRKASKFKNLPNHPIHIKYKEAQKNYDKAIKYNKKHHWRDWLERATDPDIWTANKYIAAPASDGGSSRIPELKYQDCGADKTANVNQDKSEILAKTFFPSKPPDYGNEVGLREYPEPACGTHKITKEQIRKQIKRLRPYKAPGPDKIPISYLLNARNS